MATAAQVQAWFALGHTAQCCETLGEPGRRCNHLTIDVKLYGRPKRILGAPRTNVWYNPEDRKWMVHGIRRPRTSKVEDGADPSQREGIRWEERLQLEKWEAIASLSSFDLECNCGEYQHQKSGKVISLQEVGIARRKTHPTIEATLRKPINALIMQVEVDVAFLTKMFGHIGKI
jgi:hypothetical protein